MSTAIPPEFDEFVRQEIASGNYGSAEEVIADGLHLLQEQKRRLSNLREEIQPALDQLDRGEGIEIKDDEELRLFFEDIKAQGRKQLEAEQNRK